jgi:hypothetical protein
MLAKREEKNYGGDVARSNSNLSGWRRQDDKRMECMYQRDYIYKNYSCELSKVQLFYTNPKIEEYITSTDGCEFVSESGDGVLNTTGFMDKVREETGCKDKDLTSAEGGMIGERWHFHVCIFKVTQWDYKCI